MDRWGAADEEVEDTYPGRELIPDGVRSSTMAVTIEAPPASVWPWLVQMGYDRAGWYSRDRLDNGGRPSARGERGVPAEQMLRDMRINRIFEGSSEIMRLFIAREAVDAHLSAAGELIDPQLPPARRARAAAQAGGFYARWLPTLVTGEGQRPRAYGEFGPLAAHLRYVERASRKLARATFYGMARWQGRLEHKQGFLGRIVDIGAELFAMSAACVRAQLDVTAASGTDRGSVAVELAGLFCAQAKLRAEELLASCGATQTPPTRRWHVACWLAATRGLRTASSTRRYPGRGSVPPSQGHPRPKMCTATSAEAATSPPADYRHHGTVSASPSLEPSCPIGPPGSSAIRRCAMTVMHQLPAKRAFRPMTPPGGGRACRPCGARLVP
jgi:Acyl-CoA dehydrogenase, C-terminal domain